MSKLPILGAVAFLVLTMSLAQAGSIKDEADFGPYLADLNRRIKRGWFPPKGREAATIIVVFKLARLGELSDLRLLVSSGFAGADKAALQAVQMMTPRPLPVGAHAPIEFQFTFDRNTLRGGGGAALSGASVPLAVHAQENTKIDSVEAAIRQMHGFSMRFRPSGRSDGGPDLESIKRDEIVQVLRAGGDKAVLVLAQELKSQDLSMRKNASFVLAELAGVYGGPRADIKAAIPALIEALKDSDFEVKVWSMSALSSLGSAAEAAIPALKDAANDRDQGIRTNAKAALDEIQGKK